MSAFLHLINFSLLLLSVSNRHLQVDALSTHYSFSRQSNTLDDGHKTVTEIKESALNSARSLKPETIRHEVNVEPSKFRSFDDKQIKTNVVGVPSDREYYQQMSKFFGTPHQAHGNTFARHEPEYLMLPVAYHGLGHQEPNQHGHHLHRNNHHRRQRGFRVSQPRNVQSPALSVDSGGGRASGNMVSELSKVFNVKQGFYSDLYDKFDLGASGVTLTTRKPADVIEDLVRNAVNKMIENRERQREQVNQNQPHHHQQQQQKQ